MTKTIKTHLLATAACLAVMAPLPVLAQTQATANSGGETVSQRDELIVTSRFREESVQDIGASVTGVSADQIKDQGIRDFEDLTRLVVGMQNVKTRQNSNDIAIRGVINSNDGARSSGAVYSVFLDDVSVASPGEQRDFSSVDLNRIEVIRGPQPTLFGEGAVGGVIRYFTNDPDLDGPSFTGEANAQIETIEDGGLAYSGENATSLILSPGKLGVRLSGFYRKDEGFIDNPSEGEDVNDFDTYGARAVVLAKPTEALEIRLSAFIARDELGEATQVDPGSDPEDLTFSASPMSGNYDDDFDLFTGRASYDFGALKLTSITGYYERRTASSLFSAANSFGLAPFFASDTPGQTIDTTSFLTTDRTFEQWSQEFRLVSDFDGPLNFTSGLYFRNRDTVFGAFLECAGCVAVTNPATSNLVAETSGTDATQYSGFAEVTYDLTDRFRLIGGARYVDEKITANLIQNNTVALIPRFDASGNLIPWTESDPIGFISSLDTLNAAGFGTEFDFKLNKLLPRAGMEFDLMDDVLLYANVSKGARNGGVAQAIAAVSNSGGDPDAFFDSLIYGQDSVISVEGGAKTSWMNGDLIVNLGAFHTKYKDTQIISSLPATLITNGPDQEIFGVEIETSYRFNDYLSGFFNATLLDAEFTDDFTTVNTPPPGETAPYFDLKEGNSPPQAPDLSFSTGYSYSRPIGSGGLNFTSNGSFQYIGERNSTVQNYPSTKLDSLEIMNLRIGVENDAWALNLFATNLLNDIEAVNISANFLAAFINADGVLDANQTSVNVNRPRTIGLSLTLKY